MVKVLLAYPVQNKANRKKCSGILSVNEMPNLRETNFYNSKINFGLELLKWLIMDGLDGR